MASAKLGHPGQVTCATYDTPCSGGSVFGLWTTANLITGMLAAFVLSSSAAVIEPPDSRVMALKTSPPITMGTLGPTLYSAGIFATPLASVTSSSVRSSAYETKVPS